MGLSLAKRTRLWQEQGSVDPPIDAIGLDWGLYRAGPLIEAEILTPISSRYNGELDAAMRRGASLHKKMLPMKMVDEPSAARTGVSSLPERRNPQWFGDHFLLSTLFGHGARENAGCRYNYSFPFHSGIPRRRWRSRACSRVAWGGLTMIKLRRLASQPQGE